MDERDKASIYPLVTLIAALLLYYTHARSCIASAPLTELCRYKRGDSFSPLTYDAIRLFPRGRESSIYYLREFQTLEKGKIIEIVIIKVVITSLFIIYILYRCSGIC